MLDPFGKLKSLIIQNNNFNNQQHQQHPQQHVSTLYGIAVADQQSMAAPNAVDLQRSLPRLDLQTAASTSTTTTIDNNNNANNNNNNNNNNMAVSGDEVDTGTSAKWSPDSSSNDISCSESISSNSSSSNSSNSSGSSNGNSNNSSGVAISSEGFIKNIPPSMLVDQYGILGLAMMLKNRNSSSSSSNIAASTTSSSMMGPNELARNISLIMGHGGEADLAPLVAAYTQQSILDKCDMLPLEYDMSRTRVRDKLMDESELMLKNCSDELLFYLFYTCCRDELQAKAYAALSARNWSYKREAREWTKTCVSGNGAESRHYVFDANTWQMLESN